MSRFTDAVYQHWLRRNGSAQWPLPSTRRGMGGVPPMGTAAPAPAPALPRSAAAANDGVYARPGEQDSHYVDKSKN